MECNKSRAEDDSARLTFSHLWKDNIPHDDYDASLKTDLNNNCCILFQESTIIVIIMLFDIKIYVSCNLGAALCIAITKLCSCVNVICKLRPL